MAFCDQPSIRAASSHDGAGPGLRFFSFFLLFGWLTRSASRLTTDKSNQVCPGVNKLKTGSQGSTTACLVCCVSVESKLTRTHSCIQLYLSKSLLYFSLSLYSFIAAILELKCASLICLFPSSCCWLQAVVHSLTDGLYYSHCKISRFIRNYLQLACLLKSNITYYSRCFFNEVGLGRALGRKFSRLFSDDLNSFNNTPRHSSSSSFS